MKRAILAAAFSVSASAGHAASAEMSRCSEVFALVDSDPAGAAAQLETTIAQGLACGGAEENLLRAYLAYKAQGEKSREAQSLRRALKNYDELGGAPSRLLGLALNSIARRQLAEGKEEASKTAERAEQVLLAAAPDDRASRARAIIWQGAARLIKRPNFSSDLVDAFEDVTRARILIDDAAASDDPAFLEAVAWQAAVLGLIAGDPRARVGDAAASAALGVSPAECDTAWKRDALATVKRRRSWSGHLMHAGGMIGAAVIIDARPDGSAKVRNVAAEARFPTLDETPQSTLRSRDKSIERALDRWRASADAAPECKTGVLAALGAYRTGGEGAGAILKEWPVNYEASE